MARRTKKDTAAYEQTDEPAGDDEPTPLPQAAGDPGQCGETACWSRTPITLTHTQAALAVTVNSPWTGGIVYDYGDGTTSKTRGEGKHTYAAAGTYQVKASPVASSCAAPSAPVAVTVA